MKKRSTALVVAMSLVVALFPTGRAESLPSHETIYTQWYDCVIGPYPGVVGEWVSDCRNEFYGWGDPPGAECTYTVVSQGESCL